MKYPLMSDNITREDLDLVIEHLKKDNPKLTNGPECRAFEEAWSKWLGVKYSVFVNSGASANLLSMTMLKILHPEGGEVIVLFFMFLAPPDAHEKIKQAIPEIDVWVPFVFDYEGSKIIME